MPYDRNHESVEDLDAPDPRLAEAFASLPRELPLSPDQEERTVAALRALGLLRGVAADGKAATEPLPRPRHLFLVPRLDARARRRLVQVGVGIAASLALFAAGTSWGEARASQRTLEALLAQRQPDARTAARLVQRAGSAYVTSVADFASGQHVARDPAAVAQGREAAQAVLRAAAAQVAALDPTDPLARQILRALNQPARDPAREPARDVVWF